MDSGLLKLFRLIYEGEKIELNHKLVMYLFFICIAALLWFLIALNKEYTTELLYPVQYINFPKDKILLNRPTANLSLTVRAYGYVLLRQKLTSVVTPVIFNVNSFSLNRMPEAQSDKFFILTRLAKDKVKSQLGQDIQILEISPDTLIFEYGELASKTVPIKPNLEIVIEKQYLLKGAITIVPDSVTLIGPNIVIDTIDYVKTEFSKFYNINKPFHEQIALEKIKHVNYSHSKVDVTFYVEKFTESSYKIPIEVLNIPDSIRLITFPQKVTVSFCAALSDFINIKPYYFRAVVDYTKIKNVGENKLPVSFIQYPKNLHSFQYYPESVEYIIEK